MDMDQIICICHNLGLKQREILHILVAQYDFSLSIRQLRRILRRNKLYRRKCTSDIVSVADFVAHHLNLSGQQHGYRFMHLKCILAGFSVSMENVGILLKILDPECVELCRRRRLIRCRYYAKGPNYIWNIDSYDKLKLYGIAINGCIDEFSRYMVWLEANFTSSDPKVVGSYFINAVDQLGGCPQLMRADRGKENDIVRQMQTFFGEIQADRNTGETSFLYGRSTANQRIENWWGSLRRQLTEFWVSFFHELKENGFFNGGQLEKEIVRFTFMDIIQVGVFVSNNKTGSK